MSEVAAPVHDVPAGELLRQAREAAGLHVATLAANLKVPVAKLEALEADRYDMLPDAVFVRALASSLCRTLKVDPQPVLERLPQTERPRLVPESERLNAPFRSTTEVPQSGLLDQVSRPVALTAGALVLGALVLVFLPQLQSGYQTAAQAVADAQRAAAVPARPDSSAVTVTVSAPPAAPSEPVPAAAATDAPMAPVAPIAPARIDGPVPLPTLASAAPAAPALTSLSTSARPADVPSASAGNDARGIISFRTRGASWVQVTDASGATVFRKLMEGGEVAGVSGTLPLSVTVGSVDSTQVEVRGKPFNLAPVSKDNVARFQVR